MSARPISPVPGCSTHTHRVFHSPLVSLTQGSIYPGGLSKGSQISGSILWPNSSHPASETVCSEGRQQLPHAASSPGV